MSKVMENFGLPAGRYPAVVEKVDVVQSGRKKEEKKWQLRLAVAVERNGKTVLEFRPLGGDEPYALSKSQRDGLRTMAERLGVQHTGPAEEIVAAIEALQGARVTAYVRPTKMGMAVTCSKNGDEPEVVSGDVLDRMPDAEPAYRQKTLDAQGAHEQLLAGLHHAHRGLALAAEACWRLREDEGWVALGYDSISNYLASPEVAMARSTFYSLADIWEQYVEEGGIDRQRLCAPSKLEVPLPAIKAGDVTAEEAISDAEALGLRDLRAKYRDDDDEDGSSSSSSSRGTRVEFPIGCRSCGSVIEDETGAIADGIVYRDHRWPADWEHEQVVAAVAAAEEVA